MSRVVVTGGSGKLGRACVRDLREHGYDVVNVDTVAAATGARAPVHAPTSTDFGQTLRGAHRIDDRYDTSTPSCTSPRSPRPACAPNPRSSAINTLSHLQRLRGGPRGWASTNIVWASSETVLGLPFDVPPPYVPVDEEYPARPESAYSLSSSSTRRMANQFCRWDPELKIVGLRFSNVMYAEDYAEFPSFDADAAARKWNLWGYIDARDGAQAIRRAIETEFTGAEVFIIANADTVMSRPNAELVAEVFPGVRAARRRRRQRDAAVDRQGPARARLRAGVHLARLGGLGPPRRRPPRPAPRGGGTATRRRRRR